MRQFPQSSAAPHNPETRRDRLRFGLLTILLGATFLMGGSARSDVSSLLILRPLSAVIFVATVLIAMPQAWHRAPWTVTIAAASLALCLLQLVPLPAELWSELPGRQIAVDVYRSVGLPLPWHPLTLTPQHTWNAAFFLLSPLSALILALTLRPVQVQRVLAGLIGFAILSAGIGALQSLGTPWLHWYAITNRGAAVGLFANQNHAALLSACALPLLGLYTGSIGTLKGWAAVLAAVMLIPMILLTGSRAGLAWAALALPMMLWVHGRRARSGRLAAAWPWLIAVAVAGVAATFVMGGRVAALLRLADTGGPGELRLNAAAAIWRAVGDHWPWGSGIGSFVEVYGIYEPQDLLGVAYLNHAHNDVLELLLTGGLPAAFLMVAGVASLVRAAPPAPLRGNDAAENRRWARAGWSIITLLSLASLVDYPLRTPILAVLLAVAAALVARKTRVPPDVKGSAQHDRSDQAMDPYTSQPACTMQP
ncbi:MAG: O-antigen ligase family protein [Novosphingobium sp.]